MRKDLFCVTIGHESSAAERVKDINSIIKNNSNAPLKDVIQKIAKISTGAWYNYFSKGPMRGKISNATVGSLKNFFNLPEDVFSGKIEFTDEHRAVIAAKIKEEFGNAPKAKRGPKPKKAALTSAGSDKKPEKVKKEKTAKTKKVKPEGRKLKTATKPVAAEVVKAAKVGRPRKEKQAKAAVKIAAPKTPRDLDAVIKQLAYEIETINDSAKLIKLADAMDKLAYLALKKIDFCEALKAL
jgi:hypothetical protein